MQATRLFAIALAASTLALPAAGSAPNTEGCTVDTVDAVPAGSLYVYLAKGEIWQESNEIAGLQRTLAFCTGAPPLPADTCIKHSENGPLVSCAALQVGTLAP